MQFLQNKKNDETQINVEIFFDRLIQVLIDTNSSEFARSVAILKRIFKASEKQVASAVQAGVESDSLSK